MRFTTKVVVTLCAGTVGCVVVAVVFPKFTAAVIGGALLGAGVASTKYALSFLP